MTVDRIPPDVTDHGLLDGLTDDDHTQYLREDGARELSADWDIGADRQIQAETIRSRDTGGLRLGGYDVTYTDIDFTDPAWTEEDPNTRITPTATKVAWAGLARNEDAWFLYDFGANYFDGDFRHELECELTAADDTGVAYCWALTNLVDEMKGIIDGSGDFLAVWLYRSGADYEIRLRECDGGAVYTHTIIITVGTTYYLTVIRDESVGTHGTLYCYIYTDSGRTILHGKLELALHTSKKDFRYLYTCNTYNSGDAATQTGYTQNLKISTDPFGIEKGIYVHDSGIVDTEMQSGCRVRLSGNQTIGSGGSPTIIEFDTEDWDIQNEFNTATYKFTVTKAGKYICNLNAQIDDLDDVDLGIVYISVNGTIVRRSRLYASGGGQDTALLLTVIVDLVATDFVEFSVYHNQGANQVLVSDSAKTYAEIQKIA